MDNFKEIFMFKSFYFLLLAFLVTMPACMKPPPEKPVLIHEKEIMVSMKSGCFQMGDTFGDVFKEEKPVHEVCVDDFYMGEHEVTQREWLDVMGNNPSNFKDCGGDCPVEQVSWNDVQEFIRKLNNKSGMRYRLPTEAEWEYAAREGGKKIRFGIGKDTIGPDDANFNANEKYKISYSRPGVFRGKTMQVKSFSPNGLGLYDMNGNVCEWVSDWYDKKYYNNSPKNNPKGPDSGERRVLRGGSWFNEPKFLRAAYRFSQFPVLRSDLCGFRLARTPLK